MPANPMAAPLRVLLLGDFGKATAQRDAVAAGMAAEHRRAPFDLGLMVGDNLYECGPDPTLKGAERCTFLPGDNAVDPGYRPPEDPRYQALFEEPLAPLERDGVPLPFFLALGNHDVATWGPCLPKRGKPVAVARTKACLEVARRTDRWNMPGRHYVVDQGPARFIVMDGNLLEADYGGFTFEDEVAFVRTALEGCGGRRCFLVSHHPPYTAGVHRDDSDDPVFVERMRRIESAGRFDAWIAGHDHDLQHLRSPGGYDVFVSGNGAKARRESLDKASMGAQILWATGDWGYAVMELWASGWTVRFLDPAGKAMHCCAAQAGGACAPTRC
jgi:hypothetical protein